MLQPISIVFLTCFALVSIGDLVLCFFDKLEYRKFSKPFIMLFLALFCFFTCPSRYFLWIAGYFGFLGDIFFLYKHKKLFVYLGLGAFLLEHLFLLSEIISLTSYALIAAHYVIFGISFGVVMIAGFFIIRFTYNTTGMMAFAGTIYATILLLDFAVNILAIIIAPKPQSYFYIIGAVGAFLFIISDLLICHTMFIKKIKRQEFYIMLPYICGQLLLMLGVANYLLH